MLKCDAQMDEKNDGWLDKPDGWNSNKIDFDRIKPNSNIYKILQFLPANFSSTFPLPLICNFRHFKATKYAIGHNRCTQTFSHFLVYETAYESLVEYFTKRLKKL